MTTAGAPGGGAGRGRWPAFPLVMGILVAAWTFVAFLPTLRNGFVEWDDVRMFLENPYHRGSWAMRLRGAWATHLLGEYMPVTWTSYALDRTLWDLDAGGYHLTSLALHVAATLAVYAVAWRLLGLARGARLDDRGRALAAAAAALVFGVHPLRVEPVAWVSARGTVLGGLLLVLAVLAYLAGWERGRAAGRIPGPWLAGVAGLFVASVLARATGLVLPAVLLLLDVYPLRRIHGRPGDWDTREARRALAEKLGLAALGALAIPMGFLARSNRPLEFWRVEYDPTLAGAWSVYSGAFYVWKTVWPQSLGPIYVMPARGDFAGSEMALAVATIVGVTVVAVVVRRHWPALLAAWLTYVIILAPMSGLVPYGRLLGVVDRYSYAATIGWAIAAGSAAALTWEAWTGGRLLRGRAVLSVAAVSLVLLWWSILTWRQVQIWHDSRSLWAQAVVASPGCVRCHVNLANRLDVKDGGAEALAHYERALSLAPEQVEVHTNMGLLLVRLGRPTEAIPHYERVLARYPDRLPERVNLVTGLVEAGRLPEAVARLAEASRASSPSAQLEYFEGLTRAQPTAPVGWLGLFLAETRAGDQARARAAYETLAGLHAELARVALGATFRVSATVTP